MRVVSLFLVNVAIVLAGEDLASLQIIRFGQNTSGPVGTLTTSYGAPVPLEDTSTLNEPLIYNQYFMDNMLHLTNERIPERLGHPQGSGAFGYFEVTHNFTDVCKARLFSEIGKKTPIVVRFSTAFQDKGCPETNYDARGFAVKFYTEDGNFDLVGFNTPMYLYKDPVFFSTFLHAFKRNPVTNLPDLNVVIDLLTLRPESFFYFMYMWRGPGIPDGYRHMSGHSIHTYEVVNARGEMSFVRFHCTPDAGMKSIPFKHVSKVGAQDPDYATRDLYNSIQSGNFPSWTVSVQVLSMTDVENAEFDVFDVTKVLPVTRYPLWPVGKLILNRNPSNYFADVEQVAFSPANVVPGIVGAPDKLYEGRCLAYRNAHIHRLGANFNMITVNRPLSRVLNYNRDGPPPVGSNGQGVPTYFPNSYHGPVPYREKNRAKLIQIQQNDSKNFDQAADLYTNMTKEERKTMLARATQVLKKVTKTLQERAVKVFSTIHPDFGERIARRLRLNTTNVCW